MSKKLFLGTAISLLTLSALGFGSSIAWLYNTSAEISMDTEGGIVSSYFHCGTGTEEDPYVITRPVHLYNLTELYDKLEGFAEANHYFQFGYDLDNDGDLEFYNYDDNDIYLNSYSDSLNMSSYSFLPIGDSNKPFNGHINGSDLEIKNLKIESEGISDIGFFGYVGNEATINNIYLNYLTVDINKAVDDNHNVHNNAYVGYIAGHIEDANCFDNVYVNNCKIVGKSCLVKNDWGYFGKCENAATLESFVSKASQGQGDDWGGSIDMKAFNQRIHDIFNTQNATYGASYYGYYQTDEMKISFGRGGGSAQTYLRQDPNTVQTYYLLQNEGLHYSGTGRSASSLNMPGTVMPILANNDFSASDKNTGYIIGDTRKQSGRYLFDSSIRSSSYKISHIGNSLSDIAITNREAYTGSGNGANVAYESNKVEILTNNSPTYGTNNFVLIKDAFNQDHTILNDYLDNYTKNDNTTPEALNLEKYNKARESLDSILDEATLVHGLHFMDKDISYNNTTSLPTVKLNGQSYSNYSFPQSCIDFNLKENGKINFFGGSYYNGSSESKADCFFSLSVIERNGTNLTNNSIKKISYIYKNNAYDKNNPDSQKYVYRYSDNSYSGNQANVGDLVFDMKYLSETPPVQNAIYYFEIPVNKGEYALHGVSGHDAGGYLMYLDIGVSGSAEEETLVDDFKTIEYRSRIDKTEHNILLITYEQQENQEINLEIIYDETRKKYNINYSGSLSQIKITTLDTNYIVYFNNELLEQTIGTKTIDLS